MNIEICKVGRIVGPPSDWIAFMRPLFEPQFVRDVAAESLEADQMNLHLR
jgi:hypothetical protein